MFGTRSLGLALLLANAPTLAAADTLADRIAALTRDFKGTVSLYARNLDTGQDFGVGADSKVRTASTIKLPILCALESLVSAGTISWDLPITVHKADQVAGGGILGELSDTLPLRDVATLMIIVSDNTATNLILDRISADAVNDYLDTIGLATTRSMRKVRGASSTLQAEEGWSRAGRLPENQRYGIGVSTPRDMVRLLDLLEQGRIVSPAASTDVIGILKRQQDKTGIGRHAGADVEVASKPGSLDALRSDVGIAYTKGGRIAMAITVEDMPSIDYSPDNPGEALISEIAKALMAGLAR